MKGRHAKNRFFAIMTALLLIAATLGSAIGAMAATTDTIEAGKTGSITLYKYDWTAAEEAGVSKSSLAATTGSELTSVQSTMSKYALQGVVYTYVKVGDIYTWETTTGTTATVEVLYSLSSAIANALGLTATTTVNGTNYYEADDINTALAAALSSNNTSIKNTLESYVKNNGGTAMSETGNDGKTSVGSLAQGLYLIVETKVPEEVNSTTDPFFVSIPMTDAAGENWIYDIYVYPKNQTNNPTIDKKVKSDEPSATYEDTATASEGDIVSYQIASKLPTITSEATYLTEFTYVDVLTKGFSYTGTYTGSTSNDVAVKLYKTSDFSGTASATLVKDTDYTVGFSTTTNSNDTMTIALTTTGLAKINPTYSDYYLVVTYTAKVGSDADVVLGDSGNPNEVKLTYGRTNTTYTNTLEDKAKVYSYGLDLTKTLANAGTGDLTTVKFVLQNSSDNYYVVANKTADGVYYVTGTAAAESGATSFSPDSSGKLKIYGLEADTYVLTETETVDGYSLLKSPITIVINKTDETITASQATQTGITNANSGVTVTPVKSASATVDGNETSMSKDTNNTASTNALADLSVVNTKSFTLPQTGGLGTILFTIGGALVVILGAVYLTRGKKKTAQQ
ncbi:MAG: SpaH/EbpB family LPXTG-anchored major pilin [Lachnospiraceae bacterium]|nr:SpaH/EbpB family LPXTG-anchored major pilin [Lachnospiraceae bacterium]